MDIYRAVALHAYTDASYKSDPEFEDLAAFAVVILLQMPDGSHRLWTVLADTVEGALPCIRIDNVGSFESEAVGLVYAIMYIAGLGVYCP
eukprot:10937336-Karenia_brevis.AAC.1